MPHLALIAPPPAPPRRDHVGPYRLLRPLGEGATGRVFLASRRPDGPEVALKLPRPARRAALPCEVAALGVARHRAVVALLDYRLDGDTPYLVTERLDGAPLDAVLRARGPLGPRALTDLVIPVCDALARMHAEGVVHRDLKPANLLLARGPHGDALHVVDFGEARVPLEAIEPGFAMVDDNFFTAAYVAPEAREGRLAAAAPADQYALGALLYECLSGSLPFPQASDGPRLYAQLREDYAPVEHAAHDLPAGVAAAVRRALRASPRDRFPTLWHLAKALLPFASESVRAAWRPALSVALRDDERVTAPLTRTLVRRVPQLPPPLPPTPPPSAPPASTADDAVEHVRSQARRILAAGFVTALLVVLASSATARRRAPPAAAPARPAARAAPVPAPAPTPRALASTALVAPLRPAPPSAPPRAPHLRSRPALPRSAATPTPPPSLAPPELPTPLPAASEDEFTLSDAPGVP